MRKRELDEYQRIKKLIYEGVSLQDIHEMTGETLRFLRRNFGNYIAKKNHTRNLGHKDEAYYTETEMLKGHPTYTYESLSEEEKEIFNRK